MGRIHQTALSRREWLALAGGSALVRRATAQDPAFRVDVQLVRLLVTVKDDRGAPVGSLSKDDFQLLDNNVEQEIVLFERHTEQPLSVALMLDISLSTAKDLKLELESVQRFLTAMFREGNEKDAVSFYTFNDAVVQHTGYTRNMERFRRAMRGLKPAAGTSLYDAIYVGATDLEQREGRHVLVAVTDGSDTTSNKTFHDALRAAQLADTVLYPILIVPIPGDAGRNVGGENALETLAAETGGRVFTPTLGASLDRAFEDMLRDLRTQYLLGFYPRNVPQPRDGFHRLSVRVPRPGVKVFARSGYYSGQESSETPRVDPARGPSVANPQVKDRD